VTVDAVRQQRAAGDEQLVARRTGTGAVVAGGVDSAGK